ncbi:hypothetical protein [Pseudomonas putida]|uniref:hypothetical protein n=1 Tax=Pseudomonas putida TaxID=303 RepID=UPI0023640F6B|nr:hypothetical protein [Pseudomonas putida]MDD2145222.1 hypothetical protein [Pseudomonas putida]HDS1708410.1 hypothetical protein [Pseudomonas putida]
MSRAKENHNLATVFNASSKKNEGVTSVSLSFEGCLIESSKRKNSYSSDWIEAEIEKSSSYFTKEIYSQE